MNNSYTMQIEIIKKLLTTAAGKEFSPKKKSILIFLKFLKENDKFNFTLHTCLLKVTDHYIKIYKEILDKHSAKKIVLKKGNKFMWQNRFFFQSKKHDIEFQSINCKNWPQFKEKIDYQNSNIEFLVIQSLPVIFLKGLKLVPFVSDRKQIEDLGIKFYFDPKTSLQKKNFF